ncbi:MAG: SDR family NAD(P)-dependent oxidoreductase [Solirubrobacterales bacterium]
MEQLRDLNALVTGAGGGLGEYIARALAAEGVNLALTDLPGVPLDELAEDLRRTGVRVEHTPADLADAADRARLVEWAAEALSQIDVLVNNAGIEFGGPFAATTEPELEAIVTVNLLAVMDLTRLVLPGMQERSRGHIVNIASLAGKAPSAYLASYSATKHGVVGFTHSLRAEHGAEPVGFTAVCPVFISRVGMYGRLEDQIAPGPNPLGTLPPERVGSAVVRALRGNPAEVIVASAALRPIIWLYWIFPGLTTRLARNRRSIDFAERFAKARGRL